MVVLPQVLLLLWHYLAMQTLCVVLAFALTMLHGQLIPYLSRLANASMEQFVDTDASKIITAQVLRAVNAHRIYQSKGLHQDLERLILQVVISAKTPP